MLKDLYYKIRWEGFTLGGNGQRLQMQYQPMRKGCTRWHFSTFDVYQAKGCSIHFGIGRLYFWRHYPERSGTMTVGERGCW